MITLIKEVFCLNDCSINLQRCDTGIIEQKSFPILFKSVQIEIKEIELLKKF